MRRSWAARSAPSIAKKRKADNIGGMGKEPVFALVERGGRGRSQHVGDVTAKTLRPILESAAWPSRKDQVHD